MASPASITEGQRIIYLTLQYIHGTISLAESQELDAWKSARNENLLLFEELINESKRTSAIEHMQQVDVASALERVNHRIDIDAGPKHSRISGYMRIAAAIAAILVLTTGILFYTNTGKDKSLSRQAVTLRDGLLGQQMTTKTKRLRHSWHFRFERTKKRTRRRETNKVRFLFWAHVIKAAIVAAFIF